MAQRYRTDWVLFWTIVVMVFFGIVMVYSASSVLAELKFGDSTHFVVRQIVWAAVSFTVLMYAKKMDYRKLKEPVWAFAGLGGVLIMLITVYVVDYRTHRWFRSPLGSIQPSELAKPALILFLAYFVASRRQESVNNRHTLMQGTLAMLVLAVTVAVPDLGTAMVLVATAGVLFFVAGLEPRYCVIAAVAVVIAAGIAVVSKPYRVARVVTSLDPDGALLDSVDPKGVVKHYMSESNTTRDATYQPRQSRIAVGSGGFFGLGLMQGRQKWLFLPEPHTDYIYAIIGEELGFPGCVAVLGAFVFILYRGLRLYWTAPDDFGRYLALGITTSIVVQALINMSVVLDMGPTKGIPLPMISNGGSSLVSTLLCLGLLLSVSEQSV